VSPVRSVLITGAGGQVGLEAIDVFAAADWAVHPFARAALDVTDRSAVHEAIEGLRPTAVVNLSAWNAVDDAEADPAGALAVNAMAVRYQSAAARAVGARFCHVSTDYVFDGTKATAYDEWDPVCPASAYGRSKAAGEAELGPDDLCLRTSWVAGARGSNVVKTVLRLAEADPDRQLAFVDDQRGCPTFAADLASMLHTLVAEGHTGTFHVTNARAVSWYEFVQEILVAAGHSPDRVRPIATAELDPPRPAPRPANSELAPTALRLAGLTPLRDHAEALDAMVAELAATP
jgi:dTDP-4-dehydrorhamnose reductase